MTILDREGKDFVELFKNIDKNLHERYDDVTEYAEDMAVHAYGETPNKILKRARPREDPEIQQYRLESYEPKTKSKFGEAMSIMQKMFNEKVYSIIWPKSKTSLIKEEESLETYCTEEFPDTNSVVNYWKEEGLKKVLSNPNGIFTVEPGEPVEDNEFRQPVINFYSEDQILIPAKNEFYIIHIEGKRGKDAIYKIFDYSGIFTYQEEVNSQKYSLILIDEFVYTEPFLPVWMAGGIREKGIFKSFFDDAMPFWNKAISNDSDLDGVYINQAYPHMWAVEMDCDTCNGEGNVFINEKSKSCSECHGTGKRITNSSPYKYLSVNQDALSDNPAIVPPAGFVSPNPEIIRLLEEKVDKLMAQGMEALKMKVVVGDNQSGKAKEWDRSELHEAIKKVSDLMFTVHMPNGIHYINRFRYGDLLGSRIKDQEPEIVSPTNFDILTIAELTSEISEAETANVSSHYVTALTSEVVGKRFGTNPTEKKRIQAILDLDPHPGVTYEEKSLMLGEMSTTKEKVVISNNIKDFVTMAIEEDEGFLEKTRKEQRDVIKKMAEEFMSSSNPDASLELDPTLGGDDINTPVDVEAEAKAKLKGTVGGIEGILKIQAQVAAGITQYSSAIVMLNEIFGYEEATARAMLGSEQELKKASLQKINNNDTGATGGAFGNPDN